MGYWNIVRLLVQHPGIELNAQDQDGYTALAWAADRGHGAVITTLMEREEINKDLMTAGGWSPLMLARVQGHWDNVKDLVGIRVPDNR
ncbi:hypothetical protein CBS147372_9612 [Penicillium roqueforti]|nr:hypothetical protein CBS147372_9612 [Penicillium roqueforti]